MTDTPLPAETARQRFVRNNGESVRIMRMRAIELRREGDAGKADQIDAIADVWQMIGERGEEEEARDAK